MTALLHPSHLLRVRVIREVSARFLRPISQPSAMFLVGLTGGIATGKSTVSKTLVDLGVPVVDADILAREAVKPGQPAYKKIREQFGAEFFLENGELDRQKLGAVVFSDRQKRHLLNSIVHPSVHRLMLAEIIRLALAGHAFIVLDIPLLFEGSMSKFVQKTIVVYCDRSTQLERLLRRDKCSEEAALNRINAQMPIEEKVKRADYIVRNSGTLDDTRQQVNEICAKLRSSRLHWVVRAALLLTVTTLVATVYSLFRSVV